VFSLHFFGDRAQRAIIQLIKMSQQTCNINNFFSIINYLTANNLQLGDVYLDEKVSVVTTMAVNPFSDTHDQID
jgi:hypothetical protein